MHGTFDQQARVYLHPGQLFVCNDDRTVTTILGSCVSVVLWDSAAHVGGLNHYLLPSNPFASRGDLARYGIYAMAMLLEKVVEMGGKRSHIEAKVFGGGCMTSMHHGNRIPLGLKNVAIAEEFLREKNIPICAREIGGTLGRKLLVDFRDGSVWVKSLRGPQL